MAFAECTSLESVEFPSHLKTIGALAFKGCTKLDHVVIPESVSDLKGWAFEGCSSLSEIRFPKDLPSLEYGVLKDCTALKHVELPEHLQTIKERAFDGCTGLTTLVIPESVDGIRRGAFYGCINLTDVTIPQSLEVQGSNLFEGCKTLNQVHFANQDPAVAEELFLNTSRFEDKLHMAVGMLGDDLQSSVLINYLKRYTKQALKLFVDIDNDAMLHKILNFSFLQDEIDACFDEVFDYANKKGNVKAKAVLMNHRNATGGYEDPTDEFEL